MILMLHDCFVSWQFGNSSLRSEWIVKKKKKKIQHCVFKCYCHCCCHYDDDDDDDDDDRDDDRCRGRFCWCCCYVISIALIDVFVYLLLVQGTNSESSPVTNGSSTPTV